jgi:hypothetical protein
MNATKKADGTAEAPLLDVTTTDGDEVGVYQATKRNQNTGATKQQVLIFYFIF